MGLKGWEKNPKIVETVNKQGKGNTTDFTQGVVRTFSEIKASNKPDKFTYDGYTFRNEGEYLTHLELLQGVKEGWRRNLKYESMKFKLIDAKITNGKPRWYLPDWTCEESDRRGFPDEREWHNVAIEKKGGNVYALKKWNEVAELFRVKFPGWELREMK